VNAKQKNLVTLLLAALATGGLGLYAYFGVMKPEETEAQRKQAEEKLFATQAPGEQVPDGGGAPAPVFTFLSVEVRQSKTVMELQNGVWRVTSPMLARADERLVSGLIDQLAIAKFKTTLEESPTDADLERYGLKPPRATVTAKAYVPDAQGGGAEDPARQRTLTFYSGVENAFDGSVYLRREGDPRVYTTDGALRYALEKHTVDWRDHVVFPMKEPTLLRIEVKARKNAYTLERTTTDKPWKLTQPVDLRADAQRVSDMMASLVAYPALSFPPPEKEARIRAALEKPQVEARFVPKLGEPVRVRLAEVQVDGNKQVYALSEWGSESMLAGVDPNTLEVLDLDVPNLKDKKALAFETELVHELIIRPGAGEDAIKLAKSMDSGKWEVVSPMPGKAKEFKVASLLGSLEKLKGVAVTEVRPKSWSRYGIDLHSRGVSLLGADGKELSRLWIGSEVKGNSNRLWARGASDEVLELEKSAINGLPLALEELMEGVPAAAGTP
jgi:hypothetical protein